VRVIKITELRLVWQAACMGAVGARNIYCIVFRRPEAKKRSLRRPRCRWADNLKIFLVQCSKWEFRSADILLKSEIMIMEKG
jgi:hypothetical protein